MDFSSKKSTLSRDNEATDQFRNLLVSYIQLVGNCYEADKQIQSSGKNPPKAGEEFLLAALAKLKGEEAISSEVKPNGAFLPPAHSVDLVHLCASLASCNLTGDVDYPYPALALPVLPAWC